MKVAREFNIGFLALAKFLESQGHSIQPNPLTKLSLEQYELIKTHFTSSAQNKASVTSSVQNTSPYNQKLPKVIGKIELPPPSNKPKKFQSLQDLGYLKKQKEPKSKQTDNSWKIGQVKFFDKDKGFGFVECWDDGQDYFVHISKVDTEPIDDHDYVVFKLGPSRKKPGTYEARNVSLVSKFSQDLPYLKEQFSKYSNENFRKYVILGLPVNDVINLLETELTSFKSIDSEEQFSEFNKAIRFYLLLNTNESLKSDIASIISAWVDQIASADYKIKFWLDGILNNQPDDETLKSHFDASDKKERLIIFKRIDSSSKIELIQQYISDGEPQEVLDFVLEHLKQINELDYYTDVKSKLYETEYWADKTGYDLFETVIEHLQGTLDDKEKLSMFLSGYLNYISSDFILKTCLDISREEIEQILESEVLSKSEAFKMVNKLLTKEIEYFWSDKNIPDQEFVYTASDHDWEKYAENQTDPFKWILEISKHLSESNCAKIESNLIEKMPEWVQVELWESDCMKQIPISSISNYLQITEELQSKIDKWLGRNKITKGDITSILKSNIQSQEEIKNRKEYYFLSNHLQALANLDFDINTAEDIIPESNLWFYKLALWLEDISTEFKYDEYKTKLIFLSPDHQIRFIKKLFWLAHTEKFDLTVGKLTQLTRIDFDIFSLNQELHSDVPLDISVDIVVEAIKSFSENGKFLFDSELLTIVLKDLNLNKKHKFKIKELFEKCSRRYEAEFNWNRNGEVRKIPFGNNKFYYAIEFEYDGKLVEKVRQLPGRRWNPNDQHWGVPCQYEEQVLKFARENRFFINLEGSNYANNTHLAELKRTEIPNGITFCEGRLANKKHQMFNREFWWCANQPCFSNCETIHEAESWNEYTLLDFLTILGFNLDDGNRVGDYIEKGKYYQFISTINRFNRLLERMYCEECGHILFPIEDSHFAHHRVVRFHCENTECSQLHNEIYLHHCLNGKCNGIIDSRKSKKCPNGLYICSNKECGCCCSYGMMNRRLQNLQSTGGYIHENLRNAVENKLGHLERGEHFCYQCGELMDELPDDEFQCQSCSIRYDVSMNKFKRPHRHLRQIQERQTTNRPPNDFDEDDYSF